MTTVEFAFGQPRLKWRFGVPQLASGTGGVMDGVEMSSLSTDYLQIPVQAVSAGLPYNPSALVVKLAFPLPGTPPVSGDWKTGSWTTAPDGSYLAQVLIGPGAGGNVIAKGVWAVWVQVVGSPEIPIVAVGSLQIT